jgi:hypothetical protein
MGVGTECRHHPYRLRRFTPGLGTAENGRSSLSRPGAEMGWCVGLFYAAGCFNGSAPSRSAMADAS